MLQQIEGPAKITIQPVAGGKGDTAVYCENSGPRPYPHTSDMSRTLMRDRQP